MDESIPTTDGRALKHGAPPGLPRILLVEDDAVSQAYLAAVLEALPATVEAVASAGAALQAVARERDGHVLWLVDAHLPDADGATLLARLRPLAPWTPAIAHTASRERDEIDALLAAGFGQVLRKPIAAATLRAAVGDTLHGRIAVAETQAPVHWNVALLQQLLLDELPGQQAAVGGALAAGYHVAAAGVLHRMQGACALVGARGLDAAVRALQRAPGCAIALEAFNQAIAALLRQA